MSKNKTSADDDDQDGRFLPHHYEFDDGVDPRDLFPQGKMQKGKLKTKSLFHQSWAEKILEEEREAEVYIEAADDEEKEKEKRAKEMTAIDHDRNSRGKSPMIPVLKSSVASDDLASPDTKPKKKKSFRNLISRTGKGGRSKNV